MTEEIVYQPEQLARGGRALRRRLSTALFDTAAGALSHLSYAHPGANPSLYGVRRVRNVPYAPGEGASRQMDIYLPGQGAGPWPIALYVHGGGFRLLSKETHWMMGVALARRGFLTLVVNYRLAPRHPFPAALEDVSEAYRWATQQGHHYGGDPRALLVAGESAGANLAASLALQTCFRRPEPWARRVFELGEVPVGVLAAYGIYRVSDMERFSRGRLPLLAKDLLASIRDDYIGSWRGPLALADPVSLLTSGERPARPLPPFLLPVGGADPVLNDSHEMAAAVASLGARAQVIEYPGQPHAFHMFPWRSASKKLWEDAQTFFEPHVERAMAGSIVRLPPRQSRSLRERMIELIAA